MSNPDSFVDEVTEELRRDRQFAIMRRYGWIAVLAVFLVVGGAAFNEWRKASAQADAEALGHAITAALETEDPAAQAAAFAAIEATGDARAVVTLLAAAPTGDGTPPSEAAVEQLRQIAADDSLSPLYSDLANLKLAGRAQITPEERLTLLTPLARAGGAFRVLAEEQIALVEIELGQQEAAIARLRQLLADDEASQALRDRAAQLIVALGATPEPAG